MATRHQLPGDDDGIHTNHPSNRYRSNATPRKHLKAGGGGASLIPDRSHIPMTLLGNILLSLVLLVLPLSSPVSGPTNGFSPGSSADQSCCRPARKSCCHASCCVPTPARSSTAHPSGALPSVPPQLLISPAALLHTLWRLPTPSAPASFAGSHRSGGEPPPGMPIILRHAALLI